MEPQSFADQFRRVAAALGDRVACRIKRDGQWVAVRWSEQERAVTAIARALVAAGLLPGERVAILSQTRIEWLQADLGILSAGGVTVGIYPSLLGDEVAWILDHCGASVLIVENQAQWTKITETSARSLTLRAIVSIDEDIQNPGRLQSWDAFLASGASVDALEVTRRTNALRPEDLAAIVYTSGTTGQPKGAMLTHGNLLFVTWSAGRSLHIAPEFETLLFLPLAHVFARLVAYCFLRSGNVIIFAEGIAHVAENLRETRPHFLTSVPRIFEKFREEILITVGRASAWRRRVFKWSLSVGLTASRLELEHRPVPPWLRLRRALADRLVFRKIREIFGGRMASMVSGGAPLKPALAEFYLACGIPLLEGYGMTENSSFTNVNLLDRHRIGTVGPVGPGIEMRINDDGEILFRGPNIMLGYYADPEATAGAIDGDRWLHTGDIGEIDADGFLKITDRKKDLIVTAGGKKVAPQRVERLLTDSSLIAQALSHGDGRKFVSALIVPDEAAARQWAETHNLGSLSLEEICATPEFQARIADAVAEANRHLASYETVKRFRLLPKTFTIETGELTPTLKVRRRVVERRYQDLLDEIYETHNSLERT